MKNNATNAPHLHFKNATSRAPLDYQSCVRRTLMAPPQSEKCAVFLASMPSSRKCGVFSRKHTVIRESASSSLQGKGAIFLQSHFAAQKPDDRWKYGAFEAYAEKKQVLCASLLWFASDLCGKRRNTRGTIRLSYRKAAQKWCTIFTNCCILFSRTVD